MSNLVQNPILNSSFEEPTRYHYFEQGKDPEVRDGRRPAQYLMARAERHGGAARILHESVELYLVNRIRERVKAWRQAGYPAATRITKDLLDYWSSLAMNTATNIRTIVLLASRECAQLREENAHLRQMLGLFSDASGPVLAEPAPTLFPAAQPLPAIDARSPTQQKIALFQTLFRGREDVYPVLWVSERTGKKGYSPACRQTGMPRHIHQPGAGGLLGGRQRPREYLPLTDDVIAAHLSLFAGHCHPSRGR